jgi:hypothetical protein
MSFQQQIFTLVSPLPDEQAAEVLGFIECLRLRDQKQPSSASPRPLPKGTLTGLRGIAQSVSADTSTLQDSYANYLTQKYQ